MITLAGFAAFSLPPNRRLYVGDITLSDKDKAEITRQVLNQEVTRINVDRSKYETRRKGDLVLNLSTKNIKPELVPKISGVKFILLQPGEIKNRMDGWLGISYLAFDKFEVKGSIVTVTLSNAHYSSGRARRFIHIKTFTYEFRKQDAKWVGKLVDSGELIT